MKKHSFDRITGLIFACVMLVSMLSGLAIADSIYEPEDSFYNTHYDECQYINRDYYANGESGFMELFTEPGGSSLGFADNGGIFRVLFGYKLNDEVFGVVEYSEINGKLVPVSESDYKTGWIKMSDAIVKYDYISFAKKHSSEYTAYEGDYSKLSTAQNIVIWTFPNSGENTGTIESVSENFSVQSVYTDSEGRKWGFVTYYYAMKNFWVCLSDPTNTEIAALDVETPALYSPEPGSKPQSSTKDMTPILIFCVAATVVISVVLIAVLNKKKNKEIEKK